MKILGYFNKNKSRFGNSVHRARDFKGNTFNVQRKEFTASVYRTPVHHRHTHRSTAGAVQNVRKRGVCWTQGNIGSVHDHQIRTTANRNLPTISTALRQSARTCPHIQHVRRRKHSRVTADTFGKQCRHTHFVRHIQRIVARGGIRSNGNR